MLGVHRWKEAIAVAESQKHPDVKTLKQSHFEWLLETGQARLLPETTKKHQVATSSDRNMSWEFES